MAMRPTGALAVQDTVRLERGGTHVMLDGVRRPLTAGDTVEVELVFLRAGRRVVRAPVRPVVE
jgi:copper(I)-binding protein